MNIRIYKITNKVNGKCYVGQTIRKLTQRFTQHYNTKSILGNAMRKYGRYNFTIELLQIAKSKEEADLLEEKYVKECCSFGKGGYNASETGRGTWSLETSKKDSESFIMLSNDPKWYVDLSDTNKGRLLKLINNVDIKTGRIQYGKNCQQYCRFLTDFIKITGGNSNMMKRNFLSKLLKNMVLVFEDETWKFNDEFVVRKIQKETIKYNLSKEEHL